MKPAGGEFLFWMLFFAEILIAWAIFGAVSLLLELRRARREITRLTVERNRFQAWLYYRSTSHRRQAAWKGAT